MVLRDAAAFQVQNGRAAAGAGDRQRRNGRAAASRFVP